MVPTSLPRVEDFQDILDFLYYYNFYLATRGRKNRDESVQSARALAYASSPVPIEAPERFEPTELSFVRSQDLPRVPE